MQRGSLLMWHTHCVGGGHAKGSELWASPQDPPTLGGELTHAERGWAVRDGPGPRKASQRGGTWGRSGRAAFSGQGGNKRGRRSGLRGGGRTGTKKQAGQARAVHRKPRIAPDRSPGNVQGSSEGEGQQVAAADCGGPGTLSHAGPTSSCRKYSFTGFSRFLWRRCVKQVI